MKKRKQKLKFAVEKALLDYYQGGFTNTAAKVHKLVQQAIDKYL